MKQKVKYGLFEYTTENIGDEVQSIAARRFLPRIDYYFNRDNIDATKTQPDETIKLIMNGWYTHNPENWPPKNTNISPLLIAMHIEQDALNGAPAKVFISPQSKTFLNKFGPVGARNYPTLELFQKNDIKSYFSGCITLTLNPDPQVKKQNYVLAVDVPDNIYDTMLKNTSRPIIRLDTNRKRNLDRETRFLLAEFWLYLYQSAHAIITTRLHTMLPCLAFKTPVLAISGRDPKRYRGLIDLTNYATAEEYIRNPNIFNLNHPPKNPNQYIRLRKNLERRCKSFTEYDSNKSYLNGKTINELLKNPKILQFFVNAALDTWTLEEINGKMLALKNQLNTPSPTQPLGIKASTKSLITAINRKIKSKI